MTNGLIMRFSQFWEWWSSELVAIWRAFVKPSNKGKRIIKLFFSAQHVHAVSETGELNEITLSEQRAEINAYLRSVGYQSKTDFIEIDISESDAFISEARYPIAARNKLDKLLGIDIQENFPFSKHDVYSSSHISVQNDGLEHFIATHGFVKRSNIDALLKRTETLGLKIDKINLFGSQHDFNFLPAAYGAESRNQNLKKAGFGLLGLCISICILFFTFETRQKTVLEALEGEISIAKKESQEVLQVREGISNLTDKINLLRNTKSKNPMMVQLWEDVSRLLPDGSEVTHLNYSQGVLRLTGHSNETGSLIAIFEGDPKITAVKFTAPVTFDRRKEAERYTISMQYKPRETSLISQGNTRPIGEDDG